MSTTLIGKPQFTTTKKKKRKGKKKRRNKWNCYSGSYKVIASGPFGLVLAEQNYVGTK